MQWQDKWIAEGEMYRWSVGEESDGRKEGRRRSWRAVRKLAEVGLLTARKSVSVPEPGTLGVVRRDWGELRFFADFVKNRTILPCAGGTLGASRGHANWSRGSISTCSRVSKSEAGTALAVPGGGNFFAAGWLRERQGKAWAGCGSGGARRINRAGDVLMVVVMMEMMLHLPRG